MELERFGRGIDSWGAVDMFACYLSGPAWREHQVPDKLIHNWARSADRWFRRAALVSTVPLNSKARGGKGDSKRTLAVCASLVADRDDMVVKALSWALRERRSATRSQCGSFSMSIGAACRPSGQEDSKQAATG
jgi:3-methyladenine DNA glycosylase AlkD